MKNLPKRDFDEEELRDVVMKILSEKFDEKLLKKKKIISKIKVEREKERVYADGVSRNKVGHSLLFKFRALHSSSLINMRTHCFSWIKSRKNTI